MPLGFTEHTTLVFKSADELDEQKNINTSRKPFDIL